MYAVCYRNGEKLTTKKHTDSANPFGQPGFSVKSPCGRVWFVPLEQVRQDYAQFLMQADGLSNSEALAKVAENEEFVPTWFYEQFSWADVVARGQLVVQASPADIEYALNFVRDNSDVSPSSEAQAFDVPDA